MQSPNGAQENAKAMSRHDGIARRQYDKAVKENALWLLLEYQKSSGKKWTAICKEIVSIARPAATENAPLLNRQDLEGWAKKVSVIGDAKFSIVYDFLTAEETLKREEFRRARSLLEPHLEMLNRGRVLSALFASRDAGPGPEGRSSETRLYLGGREATVALCLEPIEGETFFVAHLLSCKNTADARDWNLSRMSGYGTAASGRIDLFISLVGDPREPFEHAVLYSDHRGRLLFLQGHQVQIIANEIRRWRRRSNLDVRATSPEIEAILSDGLVPLRPSKDTRIMEIVANFRWEVPQ